MLFITDRIIDNLESNERIAPLYQIMAHALEALTNLRSPHHPLDDAHENVNNPWDGRWQYVLETCVALLPRGGGFDVHPKLCDTRTRQNRLVFLGSYHETDDLGSYCGWIDYIVTATPDFLHGYNVSVRGGHNRFKDWCADSFGAHLSQPYDMNKFLLVRVREEASHGRAA